MRPLLLILGAILIVIGVVVFAVPLIPHPVKTVTRTTPLAYGVSETVGFTSAAPVAVSWTSTTAVTVSILTCTSYNANASSLWSQCSGGTNITQTGTSGSATPSVPIGGTLWIGLSAPSGAGAGPSATVTLKSVSPTSALGLWGLGGLFVLVGLVLRRRKRPAGEQILPKPTELSAPEVPPPPTPVEPSAEEPLNKLA